MIEPEHDTGVELREEEVDGEASGVGTAAEKILHTLRELSKPDPDADAKTLTIASIAMGLERTLGPQLAVQQASGELDEFVAALTRFLSAHRSDTAPRLLVVELPRRANLPAATRLHLLDEAERAMEDLVSPL